MTQGGGEAPKALSARVLVAAYWLFVVLNITTIIIIIIVVIIITIIIIIIIVVLGKMRTNQSRIIF